MVKFFHLVGRVYYTLLCNDRLMYSRRSGWGISISVSGMLKEMATKHARSTQWVCVFNKLSKCYVKWKAFYDRTLAWNAYVCNLISSYYRTKCYEEIVSLCSMIIFSTLALIVFEFTMSRDLPICVVEFVWLLSILSCDVSDDSKKSSYFKIFWVVTLFSSLNCNNLFTVIFH